MEKSEKITALASIVFVGFILGVLYSYISGQYLHLITPFNSFLFPSSAAICDFWGPFSDIKDFKPYNNVTLWVVYFPLAYFVLIPFSFIKNILISYLIFISGFVFYFGFMNIKEFTCKNLSKLQNFQNIIILTTISYPFLYLLDKGNFDMYLFVLLGLFASFFNREKYLKAAIFLAIANAIKPFSILFLVLFLLKKKFREAFLSLTLTAILVIGGFMIFPDSFGGQIANLFKSLQFFNFQYAYKNEWFGMAYSSSLFMLFKLFLCKITAHPIVSTLVLTKIYNIFSFFITLLTIFFVCKEKVLWKQLTLLICNFLLLPYITYDYKLIFLFIPLWFFVNQENKTTMDAFYIFLFGLLLIPKHFVITTSALSPTMASFYSLSVILNPIIMLVLSFLIVFERNIKWKN